MKEKTAPKGKFAKKQTKPAAKKGYVIPAGVAPELADVIKIVKFNANIRRHTSLNILKRFVEDGFIDDAKGAFVDFQWDKYTVKHNNITKEYNYDKTFVECLVEAHAQMAADSSKSIKTFVDFAGIE